MSDGQQQFKPISVVRMTRMYGATLREAFQVDSEPADEFIRLIEEADRRTAGDSHNGDER